jgi:hypothetical protein
MRPAELISLVRSLIAEMGRVRAESERLSEVLEQRGENERLSEALAGLRVENQTLKDEIAGTTMTMPVARMPMRGTERLLVRVALRRGGDGRTRSRILAQ